MATMLAKIKVHDHLIDKWENTITELVDKTLANEPEVVRYEYWKSTEPNTWYGLLSFTSKHAFFVHQDADYHRTPALGECIEHMTLEFVDPVHNASPLVRTENPPLPEDAPEGIKEWEDITPVQVANWWTGRN